MGHLLVAHFRPTGKFLSFGKKSRMIACCGKTMPMITGLYAISFQQYKTLLDRSSKVLSFLNQPGFNQCTYSKMASNIFVVNDHESNATAYQIFEAIR